MMQPVEIIHLVECAGGTFRVKGDMLGVRPGSVGQSILDEIRLHKWEIIGLLSERPAMPPGVRLIRWELKDAPVQLSRGETVVDVRRFAASALAQIDARLHDKNWLAGNWALSELLARLAVVGCVVELADGKAMLQ
jgi:hypothetical protein